MLDREQVGILEDKVLVARAEIQQRGQLARALFAEIVEDCVVQ